MAFIALALAGCSRPSRQDAPATGAPPQRIISLAPSVTEILFEVGAGGRVVATDDYSDYPPDAKEKPRIGGISVNYERVVALKPDLVIGILDLQGASLQRLRGLGLNVLAIDTTSYEKTIAAIEQVGRAVGEPDGGRRAASSLVEVRDAVRARYGNSGGASVLAVAEASPSVIVMGGGTFLDDLLTIAGGENAAPLRGYGPLSREALARLRPDIVLVGSDEEAEAMQRRFAALPDAAPRIVKMPEDILVRPGPRLGEGLEWLAGIVHAEPAGAAR